ncbi:MAG: SMP-30/gluconolactonase/LRE family protein [Acidobacteria bacterium]|nr:SMP-30/gluconolactonase/LRE family protein [Acidobacteriota bacterium]
MRSRCAFPLLAALAASAFAADYTLGPDSQRQPGVPQGRIEKHAWNDSRAYPGTVRDYWVYVPAQYQAGTPAALMVFQDGAKFVDVDGAWRVPVVLDNLIHKGQMPVTIGLFIDPGVLPAPHEKAQARWNRSFEYDSTSDLYSKLVLDEILPEVQKSYSITKDPDLRGIGGSSSGAICAFTVAWHRPDAFHRVFSSIGSFAPLRGGNNYVSLIRRTEGKPLRVFQQDGEKDLNIYAGNWWISNQDLHSALEYAGYETTFVRGTEGHNSVHGGAILPDALRWLWGGARPQPVSKARNEKVERRWVDLILDPASEWEQVASGLGLGEGPAVNRAGEVFFTDIRNSRIHRIGLDGKVSVFKEDTAQSNGMVFGPDGRLYVCQHGRKRILAITPEGQESVVAEGTGSNDIAITARGEIYYTDPREHRVWLVDARGSRRMVHEGIGFPNGLRLSPDQSILYVNDMWGREVWSFQIQPDGSLKYGAPFFTMEVPGGSNMSGADGMAVDTQGDLYVATDVGIQVFEGTGKLAAIINKPGLIGITNLVFGGPQLDTLYVTARDAVYRRKVRRQGVVSWQPVMPPKPRL